MPNAVLSEEEKARIRHHLGYILTDPVSSIQLGVPRASQPQFLVEGQMNRIPDTAVGMIRRYVDILDKLEGTLLDAVSRFKASKLGEITLRDNETAMIEGEYFRWATRLADDLGVPLNIYSERFRSGTGALPINIPVVH
jgi:hypothetical protein